MNAHVPASARLAEVCAAFLRLGLTSFGGPIAHLSYIRAECVEKRRWLDDDEYADVVALCQFLPGPSSSQVVFAIGMRRAGLLGAIGASIAFLLPSAALMIAFAYGGGKPRRPARRGLGPRAQASRCRGRRAGRLGDGHQALS